LAINDRPTRAARNLRHRLPDPAGADDPDAFGVCGLHHGPFSNSDAKR